MTIADVESRTGLTRANIRYYEREGLLCPERQENGYRNYTEDHVETLLKIKLLRKLSVSLEDIRAIQAGTVSLETVLGRQARQLGAQIQQLDHARDVCRAICSDGAGYGQMDPRKYLTILEDDLEPEPWRQADRPVEGTHPWRRYFARSLDLMIGYLFLNVVFFLVPHRFPTRSAGEALLLAVSVLVLTLFCEPVFLCLWGTTPGKWLMGIRIHRWDGGHPSYREGLQRTWDCLIMGVGLRIPLFSLYRMYRSYRQCINGEVPWDEDLWCVCRTPGRWRIAAYVAVAAAVFFSSLPMVRLLLLPPNRGDLTVAEFVENYNYYVRIGSISAQLDDQGRWLQPEPEDVYLHEDNDALRPDLQFTVEDGILTGISYEVSGSGSWIFGYDEPMSVAFLSFVGAQKDLFALSGDMTRLSQWLKDSSTTSFSGTWYGVYVQWTLETDGMEASNHCLVADGDQGTYQLSLTMKLT